MTTRGANITAAEAAAMQRALELARVATFRPGPNPRVGCVLLSPDGRVVGEGAHRGAGTPHAEVDALAAAGDLAVGATAVVTLEPCNHHGRTGPCTEALIAAGVARVVFAQSDPNPAAAGGADRLAAAGVRVSSGLMADQAADVNREWSLAVTRGRPFVTWKLAVTLDGRSAAADGTSRWVSSAAARIDTHRLRSRCDAIMVGTGTVAVDDPVLTVRDGEGRPLPDQPLRVVVGERELPAARRVFNDEAPSLRIRSRDPQQVLRRLQERDTRHVFLEGGPTLAAAFLREGLIDRIVAYVAPSFLGAGLPAVGDLGIRTMGDALRPAVEEILVLDGHDGEEPNVRMTLAPQPSRGEE
jgi:diaminohydroxyphosphoribosylaminopyrimidine deaminase/5-amino-6-(5-phosphoribosylamino)uracil reductase